MPSASHRGQRSLKFIGSTRGEGRVRTAEGEAPVDYQLDTYEERSRTSVSGSLTGDLSFAIDQTAGRLSLVSGEIIDIVLIKPDDEGADFRSA